MKKIKITLEDKPKEKKHKYNKYPRFDFAQSAFNSEEQNEKDNIEYIRKIKAKVLKRYLIPTIIISVLCIASVSAFSAYMYNENAVQVNSLNRTISARENDIKHKDEEIESLNKRLTNAYKNTDNDNSSTSEKNGAAKILDYMKSKGYTPQSSENDTSNTSSNSNVAAENNERTCAYPDCDRTAQRGSYYCYSHECSQSGCHEQIANDYSRYCYIHKCRIVDCNYGATNGGVYCSSHECIYPGCHKKKTGWTYCSEHEK